jgi:hypothetical protein
LQFAWASQVTAQSPAHFTSQLALSLQAAVLPAPRLNLQLALLAQVADEPAPALSSHLELATQRITLASPPFPLHSELSPQVSMVGPAEAALHFAPDSQRTAQPTALHMALQSTPAVQVQALSIAQVQPAPVQEAGGRPDSSFEQPVMTARPRINADSR